MDILIMLVIAMFIITAVYVGYQYSQHQVDEVKGHNVVIDDGQSMQYYKPSIQLA